MHDVEIHESQGPVFVAFRNGPDDREAMTLPQRHRAMVGADDGIELHGFETFRGQSSAVASRIVSVCASGIRGIYWNRDTAV